MRKQPRAIVTGASRGIGKALALELSKEGYEVIGTSRFPDTMDECSFMKLEYLDLEDVSSIDRLFVKYPDVDVLINNAGFSQIGSVEEISEEALNRTIAVNFTNQVLLTKKYIPVMRKRHSGVIVNVSSFGGTVPLPYATIYAAAKGAINSFTQGLRTELKEFGVKVFAVAPFQVNTGITQKEDFNDASPYFHRIKFVQEFRQNALNNAVEPAYVAKQIIRKINQRNPPIHSTVGKGARFKEIIFSILPKRVVESGTRRLFKLDKDLRIK